MPNTKRVLLMLIAIALVKIGPPKTSYEVAKRAGYKR